MLLSVLAGCGQKEVTPSFDDSAIVDEEDDVETEPTVKLVSNGKLDIDQLVEDYKSNAFNANEKYNGQRFNMYVVIDEVNSDGTVVGTLRTNKDLTGMYYQGAEISFIDGTEKLINMDRTVSKDEDGNEVFACEYCWLEIEGTLNTGVWNQDKSNLTGQQGEFDGTWTITDATLVNDMPYADYVAAARTLARGE